MTTTEQAIQLGDVRRLAETDAPDLATAILAFVAQGDPPRVDAPADAMNLVVLRAALTQAQRQYSKKQRQTHAHEAWKRYLAQPAHQIAPQMGLAEVIEALYATKTPGARAALLLLAERAPIAFGVWGGLKRVYKRAETDLDLEVFAALGARFDVAANASGGSDVGRGTMVYLRRRAARVIRLLGKATPELYPMAAVEVLRRYPNSAQGWGLTIASRIISHDSKKWGAPQKLPREKTFRPPYREAWARSPDPFMLLLETCQADFAASFAIQGLRELFPEVLRKASPEWLGRLASRPLKSAHDFLVETLEASPELHQGKLASLGLKEPVLRLLVSPSPKARTYAIEYARGHAADMSTERLVELVAEAWSYADTSQFLLSLLSSRPVRSIGVHALGRLLCYSSSRTWAARALDTEFDKSDITPEFLADALLSDTNRGAADWAQRYVKTKLAPTELPVAFWIGVLDDPRLAAVARINGATSYVLDALRKYPIETIPGDWLLASLARKDIGQDIATWLTKLDKLPPTFDLERVRGLVFDPSKRDVAFTILGNTKLVSPRDVGVAWLLALARRADPALHEWAHRYLLAHVKPEVFAEGKPSVAGGVKRLFALASGAREPEAVRAFAQLYLRCHHPKLGKLEADARQYHVKPAIPLDAFTEELAWPCLWDARGDVRRFGVALARVDLRRWGAQARVYELAESNHKEVRNLAYDALAGASDPDPDPDLALRPEELDAAQIFTMTESRKRSSRDVAMDLIRAHYTRLGGAERLGWLMQTSDREVRLFAVRLLWEKHRPRSIPADWKTPAGTTLPQKPFRDNDALRALLRRLLFMVPPVRSMEALDRARAKKLPASVAKRHVIEIVRDLALADKEFATEVAPVLAEFTGSVAKGEWQACLAALMSLRAAHGIAVDALVAAPTTQEVP